MSPLLEAKNNYEKAQRVIIGHLLNFPSSAEDILSRFSKNDLCAFSDSTLRKILEAMLALHERGTEISETAIRHVLGSKGARIASLPQAFEVCIDCAFREYELKELGTELPDYLSELRGGYYLRIIKDKVRRANSFPDFLRVAEEAIALDAGGVDEYRRPLPEIVDELISTQKAIKEGTREAGYSWGIPRLDEFLPIRPGKLYTVAAQKGAGKTKFLVSVLDHNLSTPDPPVPCLLFSLEMSELDIIKCILSRRAEIDSSLIFSKFLPEDLFENIEFESRGLKEAPLEIDSSPYITTKEIVSRIRHWKLGNKVPDNTGIVGIDFLQRISLERSGGKISEATAIKNVSYELAAAAKAMKVSIIALAQLNKEADGKRPHIGYIEGSGGPAQASEGVMLLDLLKLREESKFHTESVVGELHFILAKNRDGESGVTLQCMADLRIGKFYEKETRYGELFS